ncbi:MAG: hypothetical protein ABI904_14785 [Chloroflexota bacterium]
MLPRKTILISAVLTAFVLSMLGGVAMALKQPVAAAPVAVTTATVSLTAQEAASVAATVLNQQDIFSVESSTLNGTNVYKVVFSSGQVALVGLDGQLLSVTQIQPVVVAQNNPAPSFNSSNFNPASAPVQAPAAPQSGGEHEGGGDD